MRSKNYKQTVFACCISYITQAIVVNFPPLLFLKFQNQFDVSLSELSTLISICFGAELIVDLLAAKFSTLFSQRVLIITSQILAIAGIAGFGIFPFIFSNGFIGLAIADILCGIGGGLMEVLVSPIIEACPTDSKSGSMSFLHAFYCWGQAAVILLTTLFFFVLGIDNWRITAFLWTIIPIASIIMFTFVPIYDDPSKAAEKNGEQAKPASLITILKNKMFLAFMVIMICAGASELAMSQWASSFAEAGLGVSKAAGDIFGPCLFAIFMGTARLIYGKFGAKADSYLCMIISSGICAASYLLAAFSPIAALSLFGCALCGFSVGILWPGTLSIAAERIHGGVAMFALMALGGDIGCLVGPALVGKIADMFGGDIRISFIFSLAFPAIMIVSLILLRHGDKKRKKSAAARAECEE